MAREYECGKEVEVVMAGRRIVMWAVAGLAVMLLLYAFVDGGEEPLREIEVPLAIPGGQQ